MTNDALIQALHEKRVVLFIGAGVSATLGLPTLRDLLGHMAEELEYDPEEFLSLADGHTLAQYYALRKKGLSDLRRWMEEQWNGLAIDIRQSRVHQMIVKLGCRSIYTTNFDHWLEKAHEAMGVEYHCIVRVTDLLNLRDHGVQITKFHGDLSEEASLVLTENSYFDRLSLDSPLDLRFRADTLGRAILFLGYSLRDVDTRLLLYRLHKMWESSPYARSRPQSFVFLARPNEPHEEVLRSWGVEPIVGKEDDPAASLEEFLSGLVEQMGEGEG